ncbi:hypothetical protein I352_05110 [Cryptococcus deuterogattii MMRL2647]|nr:hypothetical protein I352_05110 [Cryptococcus deuterogattii MMRL2647]
MNSCNSSWVEYRCWIELISRFTSTLSQSATTVPLPVALAKTCPQSGYPAPDS